LSNPARSGKLPAFLDVLDDAEREGDMLRWAIAFFIIAIIAAVFGFAGIAVAAAGIAKLLFFIFLVLFLMVLVGGLVSRA
jgi:uncharacterized membrane protein YtjA (UPF0391 family)